MRIGIFGGAFDPVHLAHLNMAHCAVKQAELDKVIFVPNGNPPHKDGCSATAEQRLKMLEIALDGTHGFEVSDYEIKKDGLCYTVDTMRHFKEQYLGCELMFILGADSLDYIDRWNRAEQLKKENTFIVINRSFSKDYSFDENVKKCRALGYSIITVDMPFMDISSTMIRDMVKNGQAISKLVPCKVADYIKNNAIYLNKEL